MEIGYVQTEFVINTYQPGDSIPQAHENSVNVAAGTSFNGLVTVKLPPGAHAIGSWWSIPTWDANWQGTIVHMRIGDYDAGYLPINFDTSGAARSMLRVRTHVLYAS